MATDLIDLDQEATLRAIECLEARYRAGSDETRLTELCEAACGHARVGKLDAADLALSEAIALAVVLGYENSHRVLYAARVVAHCRSGSPDPAAPTKR